MGQYNKTTKLTISLRSESIFFPEDVPLSLKQYDPRSILFDEKYVRV